MGIERKISPLIFDSMFGQFSVDSIFHSNDDVSSKKTLKILVLISKGELPLFKQSFSIFFDVFISVFNTKQAGKLFTYTYRPTMYLIYTTLDARILKEA